jgi:hypothetical protein
MAINHDENPPIKGNYFDEDTDEAIVLPKPTPEITNDDEKKADSAFDDLEIDVDEEEVKAEADSQPPGRKY